MAIAVRKDLEMGKGKIAAQVAHAAVECSMNNSEKRNRWISEGQKKIVVWVKDEMELKELINKARSMGVNCCPIKDAGLTQLKPDTLTCSGFGPDEDSAIDSITGKFKLV
jgi:PTH2 family peptidyl-tRNA hydrolase